MIKTIFFDFDGVLTTDTKGSLTISKNLCAMVPGLFIPEVLDSYRQDIEPLNLGQTSMNDVWKRMCVELKIPTDDNLLEEMLRRAPRNNAMFDLAKSLSNRYRLGIITDNSKRRMEALTADMRLNEQFDPIIVSAIEHASKCDGTTKIFDAALARTACKAEEAIFIDNQEKNLVTPAKMGMKTYLHDDEKNDISSLRIVLRQWGVAIPIIFVPLSEAHIAEVMRWPKDTTNQWLDADVAKLLKLQSSSPDRHCYVAFDGDESMGVVDIEKNGDGTAWMSLFVRPDERGKGLGQWILQSLLTNPVVTHLHELKVEIEHDNVASLRCFEGAGFVRREEPGTTEGFVFLAATPNTD